MTSSQSFTDDTLFPNEGKLLRKTNAVRGDAAPVSSLVINKASSASQNSSTNSTNQDSSRTVISELTTTFTSTRRSTTGNNHHLGDSSNRFSIHDSKVLNRSLDAVGGQNNLLARLPFDKVGLIGREAQVQVIQDFYQNAILKEKQRKVITLSGPSGVGKTSLAHQSLKSITSSTPNGCVMAQGKWSLTDTDEPLSILRHVMNQIGSNIRNEHPEIRDKILMVFESETETLAAWMPDLLPIKNDNAGNDKTAVTKEAFEATVYSKEQLRYATTSLLALVDCPLVLVVDDAQWADPTSLDLLKCWVSDTSLNQLLIVVCYRHEEIDESHVLTQHFLAPLQEDGVDVAQISVVPLSAEQTEEFITELLSPSSQKEALDFSQLLFRSTGGNPFYLVSFIQSLVDETLLSFNLGTMKWVWDLDSVKTATCATENVADIVKKKLEYSKQASSLLPVAATLGAHFAATTLEFVCSAILHDDGISLDKLGLAELPRPSELHSWLGNCEDDGFLDHLKSKDGLDSYKFVHDRVHEAALALVAQTKLRNLQYTIGRTLAENVFDDSGGVSRSSSDYTIFIAANLLNSQRKEDIFVGNGAFSRIQLIRLNHAAGERAMSMASFSLASRYYKTAIGLVQENDWKEYTGFLAKVYADATRAAFSEGDTDEMNQYAEILIARRGVMLVDKVSTYCIKIQSLLATEQNEAAMNHNVELLEQLGVRFPKNKVSMTFSTIAGLIRAKGIVRRLDDLELAKLPFITDEREIAIVKSLDVLTSSAYHGKAELIPLAILDIFRRTLRNGLTEFSSIAFALLGLIMASGPEDFESTKACFDLAWAAQKRVQSKEMLPKLYFLSYQYLAPWFMPLQNTIRPLDQTYRLGLLNGDIENGGWSRAFHIENCLKMGKPLALVDADCFTYFVQLGEYSMLKQKRLLSWCWQAVRNLRGSDGNCSHLCGEIVDYQKEIEYEQTKKDLAMELGLHRIRMFLALSIGDYGLCANIALQFADEMVTRLPAQAANIHVRFNAALSGLIMSNENIRKYKRFAFKNAAIIRSWTKKGNPNCLHFDAFLDAERARLDSKTSTAIKSYESAIVLAARRGFIHEQALASERYADMLLSLGWKEQGLSRMQDAIEKYKEWGAMAKVNQLEAKISATD